MATFKFIYEDKQGNELKSHVDNSYNSLKEAEEAAKEALANTRINDLHKIRVIEIK